MQRSVLALLDFIKANDTVWREKLLLHKLDMGGYTPSSIIEEPKSNFLRSSEAADGFGKVCHRVQY